MFLFLDKRLSLVVFSFHCNFLVITLHSRLTCSKSLYFLLFSKGDMFSLSDLFKKYFQLLHPVRYIILQCISNNFICHWVVKIKVFLIYNKNLYLFKMWIINTIFWKVKRTGANIAHKCPYSYKCTHTQNSKIPVKSYIS